MRDAITDKTKLVFLCNPNNPTGTIYGRAAFERFLDEVPPHVLIVVDEAYFEYVTDEQYPDALGYFERGTRNLAVLRTFSKIYSLAGTRCGYGVLPSRSSRPWTRCASPSTSTRWPRSGRTTH